MSTPVNSGNGDVGFASGTQFATDDVGGVTYPVSKLDVGGAGASAPLSNANPMPVSDAGGSITVDGSVAVSNFPATQPVSGSVAVSNFPGSQPVTGPLTDTQLRASAVPISAATLPLPNGAATDATLTGGTQKTIMRGGAKGATAAADTTSTAEGADHQAVDVQVYHGGVAKDPTAIRALTNADVVTGEVSKWIGSVAPTVGQKTSANSLPVVIASDQSSHPVNGDVASGTADSGNPIKIGALAKSGLPTAVADTQRVNLLADLYGRPRMLLERPKLLGAYKAESGRLTILAAAHAATAGFLWLINPVGSGVVAYVKKWMATSLPTAVTAFASAPRVTLERVTFTGTASGAQITPAKRDSTDATNVCTVRTASTGLTLTGGAIIGDFSVPPVLTAVGIAVPVDQYLYDSTDEDDYVVLRAGEGVVLRQADAGTASDTRLLTSYWSWEER